MGKICCFAGHRLEIYNLGIKDILNDCILMVINKGYDIFYVGDYGFFDKLCIEVLKDLKNTYPKIKIIKILTYYHHKKDKMENIEQFDYTIMPDNETVYFKDKILARNRWMVNNSDLLICHIENFNKSGALKTVEYARKINKPIIYI